MPFARVYGIDVSHYQPAVNWTMVSQMGKKFAFAKASDGNSPNPDSAFSRHRLGARNAGLAFGAYHFFRPLLDPVKQADTFLRVVGNLMIGEFPLTLDVEFSDNLQNLGAHADNALLLLEKLEAATGLVPFIYTSAPFFNGFPNPERFLKYKPWLAAYSHEPQVPAPWTKWVFWQYSENERISGVDKIDGNVFNGTLADMTALTKK